LQGFTSSSHQPPQPTPARYHTPADAQLTELGL